MPRAAKRASHHRRKLVTCIDLFLSIHHARSFHYATFFLRFIGRGTRRIDQTGFEHAANQGTNAGIIGKPLAESHAQLDSFEGVKHDIGGRFDVLRIHFVVFAEFGLKNRENAAIIFQCETEMFKRERAQEQFSIYRPPLRILLQNSIDHQGNGFVERDRMRIDFVDEGEDRFDGAIKFAFQERVDDGVFAGEVLVQRTNAHAGSFGDVIGREADESVMGENAGRRLKNDFNRFSSAGLADGLAGRIRIVRHRSFMHHLGPKDQYFVLSSRAERDLEARRIRASVESRSVIVSVAIRRRAHLPHYVHVIRMLDAQGVARIAARLRGHTRIRLRALPRIRINRRRAA